MKHKLLKGILAFLIFSILSICAGPAIWLICKFVVMLGPVVCATIVMLILLGWAVYHGMENMDRRK